MDEIEKIQIELDIIEDRIEELEARKIVLEMMKATRIRKEQG